MNKVNFKKIMMGTDIELFVTDEKGDICDSHLVLGDSGVDVNGGRIEPDGIALELQPSPSTCRESLKHSIFNLLTNIPKTTLFCSHTKEIEEAVFKSLHPSSLEFGCKPSFDGYSNVKFSVNEVKIKGSETRLRCCGGHLHFGMGEAFVRGERNSMKEKCVKCELSKIEGLECVEYNDDLNFKIPYYIFGNAQRLEHGKSIKFLFPDEYKDVIKKCNNILGNSYINEDYIVELKGVSKLFIENPQLAVKVLDAFVGIPSVLLDCNTDAALRRTIYGKAGDYRLPPHGLEYRTLSNYWINSYFLFSFVFGMARHAILYASDQHEAGKNCEEIFDKIPCERIRETINENNFTKARDIFIDLEKVIIETSASEDSFPLSSNKRMSSFKELVLKGYKSFINEYSITQNWKGVCGVEQWLDKLEPRKDIVKIFETATVEDVESK